MAADIMTPTTSAPKGIRIWRFVGLAGLAALVLSLAALSWLLAMARSALPDLDGPLAVVGISGPVTVTRDSHGLPTIEAASLEDLFFAQGYVTAQDRLFQMDLMRRSARGELAEVFGRRALRHDREQRILGIRTQAEKGAASASADDRQQFRAYARGVNAYISSRSEHLPLEFRLARYRPRPWTVEDSLAIAYQMVETLSTTPRAALTREKVLQKLGPELTADLYVNSSWRDHPPTMTARDLPATPPSTPERRPTTIASLMEPAGFLAPWLKALVEEEPQEPGSNNWVLAGSHTVSGKPLLSNDMHLAHQMPNLWYETHLRSGTLDVVGVSLPGYPYVIVGHNDRVAWGFTNVGPTVEDAYIEHFNEKGEYLTPTGWKRPELRQELIHVKGEPDTVIGVQITRHGPIVTEVTAGETRKIALRWTLYDGIRNPFFRVNTAGNWPEFRAAFSQFDAPGQNVVYADVNGNIAYQMTGKVPVRATGDGSLPVEGGDNAHEWTGYVPFEKLPYVVNPASGIIATANGRITPDLYPFSISVEWEAPWRTERIYQVLASGRKFSPADTLALQTDIYSELDRFIAEKLVYALDHAPNASPPAREAANILRVWDAQMDKRSAAPAIVTRSRLELKRLLLEPKLGPGAESDDDSSLSWKSYRWMMETVWLENVLSNQPARWLPPAYSSYDQLLLTAVERALKRAPADLGSWHWGRENSLNIQNPVLGSIPILRMWTGPGEQPQSGSVYTVKAAGRDYGPSERFTADLSNLDASTLNVVTGQSGNFLSPYYMDQWKHWYYGRTFLLPFSRSAVGDAASHRLLLVPR
ncbi:MAG: penicillin acylase family protein [Acidobacteria bacterium]|nr:penicillin acylase family protein [Acidobacteriota bacterium]